MVDTLPMDHIAFPMDPHRSGWRQVNFFLLYTPLTVERCINATNIHTAFTSTTLSQIQVYSLALTILGVLFNVFLGWSLDLGLDTGLLLLSGFGFVAALLASCHDDEFLAPNLLEPP
ncbi:hypothetical protein C8J56DRAFT_1043756 [Mycena floridula]|nr:hypothetical protein C8J56DRAFT_1043756 [Mycena floridula]